MVQELPACRVQGGLDKQGTEGRPRALACHPCRGAGPEPRVGEAQSAVLLSWGRAKAGQALLRSTLPCSRAPSCQADPDDPQAAV